MSIDDTNQQVSAWTCRRCRQKVPDTFELCWNCGANRDGLPDPGFDNDQIKPDPSDETLSKFRLDLRCSKCGSAKVIPDTKIQDQGQASNGMLQVVVYGKPSTIIMKDRMYGALTADICADCGHAELKVANAQNLFEHYLV